MEVPHISTSRLTKKMCHVSCAPLLFEVDTSVMRCHIIISEVIFSSIHRSICATLAVVDSEKIQLLEARRRKITETCHHTTYHHSTSNIRVLALHS